MALVQVERRDRVAVLTLADPERRNALSQPLVDDIVGAMEDLETDAGVGAVVMTGAPPAFCAGADLSDLATSGTDDDEAAAAALRAIYEGFLRVARSSLPTVAAVNGPAVGAGLNMAMGCDVRFAAESARFDSRFVALGLHPGGGGTWMLHQALGPQGAAALGLFGEVVDGRRAVDIGLAWRCVPDEELLDAAVEFARPASEAPEELIRRLKRTLRGWPAVDDHETAVEVELEPQMWSVRQPEFEALLEKMRKKISGSAS